jgi:hypothetical protein
MLAMYDYAKDLHQDRLRAADHVRLVKELRNSRREMAAPEAAGGLDQWQILWSSSDITGTAVTMVNATPGVKHTGRDPGDWDRALGQITRQMEIGV